ncbi:MarR family transcriptional regulator [Pseudomonas putida]|uniref:DNA-binding protein n=1 Tax=Pseudomonas putida TaxID=303 RepID=A0A8I1EEI0_PSEPU|nr:helix-turn-helix domain-containing protein [Pseudomonas putida]MBI6885150.1 DNA-binding protein [Pseudomonas putida]
MIVNLASIANTNDLTGSKLGKSVFQQLSDIVAVNPREKVIGLSAAGVLSTDVSFAREAVFNLAKIHRGNKSFCLLDISDQDQLDNWSYAADVLGQPLMAWSGSKHSVLGDQLSTTSRKLFDYVVANHSASVPEAAAHAGISVPNASTTLKKLSVQGYLRRTELAAPSGGIEYMYLSIRIPA